jgi:hypothetical protein
MDNCPLGLVACLHAAAIMYNCALLAKQSRAKSRCITTISCGNGAPPPPHFSGQARAGMEILRDDAISSISIGPRNSEV